MNIYVVVGIWSYQSAHNLCVTVNRGVAKAAFDAECSKEYPHDKVYLQKWNNVTQEYSIIESFSRPARGVKTEQVYDK